MKRLRTVIMLGLAATTMSACSTSSTMFGGSDIQISATEEGMRAYGDHLNAIITNGKASADAQDTPAYELRRNQESGRTMRATAKYSQYKAKGSK